MGTFCVDTETEKGLALLREKLGLTSDQEGEIRAMAERFFIETKGRPSKEDEMRFIAQIRGVLTIEQKWKFTGLLLRGELDPEKNAMSDKE